MLSDLTNSCRHFHPNQSAYTANGVFPNEKVRICDDVVIKTAHPDLMRVEVEKTSRAFEIGRDSGLFRVPRVLDFDESKGLAVFERLRDIQGIRDVVAFGRRCDPLVEIVGASLAAIHDKLVLPKDMIIPLPPEFAFSRSEVFLHGDPSLDNICVGSHWPPIVILDWQMTKVHGGRSTYGTRLFDLMWFVNGLYYRPFHRYLLSNPIAPVARRFLTSYFERAECPYGNEDLIVYIKQFFEAKLSQRRNNSNWKNRFLLAPSHASLRRFITSIQQ